MKSIKILVVLIFIGSFSYAQSEKAKVDSGIVVHLDGPVHTTPSPLYILTHEGKEYSLDTTAAKKGILDINSIKSIDIPKDREAILKYGAAAKNGVVVITLNEQKYSGAFNLLEKYLKAL